MCLIDLPLRLSPKARTDTMQCAGLRASRRFTQPTEHRGLRVGCVNPSCLQTGPFHYRMSKRTPQGWVAADRDPARLGRQLFSFTEGWNVQNRLYWEDGHPAARQELLDGLVRLLGG
jgi:hypothetical protein